jgi:tetratricopeptide (TPR) repeat protein
VQCLGRNTWIGIAAAVALAVPAAAQTSRDIAWCNGKGGATPDQVIRGCTALIESGRESRRNRVVSHANRATAYHDKGDYDQAIADYDEAIRLDPSDAEVFNSRGVAHHHKGDYDQAIADYSEAIRLDPKNAMALRNRGLVYHDDKGDLDRAIRDFDQAIRINPKYETAFIARGSAYSDKGDYDRALRDINTAIRLDPKDAKPYYHRGRTYWAKGDFGRAVADFDEYIKRDATYAHAFYCRGRAYKALGDQGRAKQDYEHAVRLDSGIVGYQIRQGDKHADLRFIDERQLDLAIQDYDGAIELDPTSATAYAKRAFAHLNKEGADRAIEDLDRAIALDPKSTDALQSRGALYKDKQQYGRAVEDYTRALAALAEKPAEEARIDKATVLDARCYAQSMLGQLQPALADCNEAIKLYQERSTLRRASYERAAVYLKLGLFDEAVVEYDALLTFIQGDAIAIYGRGLAKLKKGDETGGNADIAAAKEKDPNAAEGFTAYYGVGAAPYSPPQAEAALPTPGAQPLVVPGRESQPPVAASKAPTATQPTPDSKTSTAAEEWKERDWCEGKGVVVPDLKIGGCTAVIQSGRATADLLAAAFNNRGTAGLRR